MQLSSISWISGSSAEKWVRNENKNSKLDKLINLNYSKLFKCLFIKIKINKTYIEVHRGFGDEAPSPSHGGELRGTRSHGTLGHGDFGTSWSEKTCKFLAKFFLLAAKRGNDEKMRKTRPFKDRDSPRAPRGVAPGFDE